MKKKCLTLKLKKIVAIPAIFNANTLKSSWKIYFKTIIKTIIKQVDKIL